MAVYKLKKLWGGATFRGYICADECPHFDNGKCDLYSARLQKIKNDQSADFGKFRRNVGCLEEYYPSDSDKEGIDDAPK